MASDEEMDEDVDERGDDDDDDDAGGVEGGGTGEVFARAAGSRDGVDEFLDVILRKRKDAIEREARAEDDGERADPPPPRVGGTGQARGGDDIPAKDWQNKAWKKQCKARDSLEAKEKRAKEVLAALESAKRSSTATPAPVAADAGSEKPPDRAPSPDRKSVG